MSDPADASLEPETMPPAPPARRGLGGLSRAGATVATTAGLVAGGLIGGYAVSHAATSSPSPSAPSSPGTTNPAPDRHHGGPCGVGSAEDEAVVAGAIGISASQLHTELAGGKTIADVARAHGVAVQKVIDAWVASENKEVDDAVTAGRITKDQATQEKSHTVQRVTAQVNGTAGPRGMGGHGFGRGPGGAGFPAAPGGAPAGV